MLVCECHGYWLNFFKYLWLIGSAIIDFSFFLNFCARSSSPLPNSPQPRCHVIAASSGVRVYFSTMFMNSLKNASCAFGSFKNSCFVYFLPSQASDHAFRVLGFT